MFSLTDRLQIFGSLHDFDIHPQNLAAGFCIKHGSPFSSEISKLGYDELKVPFVKAFKVADPATNSIK